MANLGFTAWRHFIGLTLGTIGAGGAILAITVLVYIWALAQRNNYLFTGYCYFRHGWFGRLLSQRLSGWKGFSSLFLNFVMVFVMRKFFLLCRSCLFRRKPFQVY
jgi:hypothetical protein